MRGTFSSGLWCREHELGNPLNLGGFHPLMRVPSAWSSLRLAAVGSALLVAGCDSGGGSGGGGGGNTAPTFTSSATASVVENTAGTVLTATASDPDGNALTFSISGGADAGVLQITPAGALSFRTPPDFEAPADAN